MRALVKYSASCPALCRASTSFFFKGVDGRDKPGHDVVEMRSLFDQGDL